VKKKISSKGFEKEQVLTWQRRCPEFSLGESGTRTKEGRRVSEALPYFGKQRRWLRGNPQHVQALVRETGKGVCGVKRPWLMARWLYQRFIGVKGGIPNSKKSRKKKRALG